MGIKLTIPEQEITTKQPKADLTITCFSAIRDGKLIAPCEAFGNHKAALEAAMKAGEAVEAISVEHNEQRGRYDVKLPREGGRGGKGGGGWGKPAYAGEVVTADQYAEISVGMISAIAKRIKAELPGVTDDAAVAEARSIASGFWPTVRDGVAKITLGNGASAKPAQQATTNRAQTQQAKPAVEKATRATALNDSERKTLFASAKAVGLENGKFKAWLAGQGYESTADIPRSALAALTKKLAEVA